MEVNLRKKSIGIYDLLSPLMLSLLGVVTNVTSAITGAVVVKMSSSLDLAQLTIPIIIQNNISTILLCVIFFTDKDMITLNNPSTPNIINNLGIIERS